MPFWRDGCSYEVKRLDPKTAQSFISWSCKTEYRLGETLQALARDVKWLTDLAHPSTDRYERDRLAKKTFKYALADFELRQELQEHRPRYLKTLLNVQRQWYPLPWLRDYKAKAIIPCSCKKCGRVQHKWKIGINWMASGKTHELWRGNWSHNE